MICPAPMTLQYKSFVFNRRQDGFEQDRSCGTRLAYTTYSSTGIRVFDGSEHPRLGKGPGQVLYRFLPAREVGLASAAQ